jgi:hypothetical protein
MTRTITTLLLSSVVFYTASARTEDLPPPLIEAFTKIDALLSDDVKTTLKTKDPKEVRIDPFADSEDPFGEDITNEATYDSLRSQLSVRIERKLGLGWRHPAIGRAVIHPKIEQLFVPYLVADPATQADILLELYVKNLRGGPTEWKKRLIDQRDLNLTMWEGSWNQFMWDIQKMDPAIALPLLMRMRVAMDEAEKQMAEPRGADQPANAPESKSEGNEKPEPASEARPQ